MAEKPDLYARGWEAGVETCRRILATHPDDPHEALQQITELLVRGYRARVMRR